jgi:chromosome segregation ATPase
MSAVDLSEIRFTVEQIERRFAALEGRISSTVGQLHSLDDRMTKLTSLVKDVLEFSSAQVSELRRSLDSTEEHLRAVRATLDVTAEQNGRILRELGELRR